MTGQLVAEYTFADRIDEPLLLRKGGKTHVYHQDHLGTVVGLTGDNAAVENRYKYTAFGLKRLSEETVEQPYTYTAREVLNGDGLYYYRSRTYSARTGRFTREDDARDGVNLFGYVRGNPVRNIDPNGYWYQDSADPSVWHAVSGDTQWDLAVQLFGDGARWVEFGHKWTDGVKLPGDTMKEGWWVTVPVQGGTTATTPPPTDPEPNPGTGSETAEEYFEIHLNGSFTGIYPRSVVAKIIEEERSKTSWSITLISGTVYGDTFYPANYAWEQMTVDGIFTRSSVGITDPRKTDAINSNGWITAPYLGGHEINSSDPTHLMNPLYVGYY